MSSRSKKSRYRFEDGKTCIDIHLKSPQQIFDSRDPAPFLERELDPQAVEYLKASAEDIPLKEALKIVISFSDNKGKETIEASTIALAVKNHFDYEMEILRMQLRSTRRRGQFFLIIGFLFMVLCLLFSQAIRSFPDFWMKSVLYEGFVIGAWVALWRPIDLFLFDWWPLVEKMKYCKKLIEAIVEVRA